MINIKNSSRRKFLLDMAKIGAALPFAGQMLGQNAFAATGYKNVLFLYHPNGVQPSSWNPAQGTGAISTTGELSYGLGPLKDWSSNIIVLKNIYIDIEAGGGGNGGGHGDALRGCLTGDHNNDGSASIDWLIAEKLGSQGVLNVGVRTGSNSAMKVSKPRNYGTQSRPTPNLNPFDVATKLSAKVTPVAADPVQAKVYAAAMADMNALSLDNLTTERKSKIDQHKAALSAMQSNQQQGTLNVAFDFDTKETLADGDSILGKSNAQDLFSQFPALCKSQINNVVAAFANGLHRVATLQMAVGDENTGLANYSFDECWDMVQAAPAQVSGTSIVGKRWDNEHASHGASHQPGWSQTHAQVRWHMSMVAYTLKKLKDAGILDQTLVVTISEEGNGSAHELAQGSIVVAGGTGGGLQMGRVIDCGGSKGTHQLFGDIARWVGGTPTEGPWSSGII